MDREEVIKWLKIMKANLDSFPEVSNAKKIEALAETIRLLKNEQSEMTSSEVKPIRPRKGEWCKQNDDYYDWYECSECGYGSEGEMQYSSEYDVRTNYCPNCGAEMRGEEE